MFFVSSRSYFFFFGAQIVSSPVAPIDPGIDPLIDLRRNVPPLDLRGSNPVNDLVFKLFGRRTIEMDVVCVADYFLTTKTNKHTVLLVNRGHTGGGD